MMIRQFAFSLLMGAFCLASTDAYAQSPMPAARIAMPDYGNNPEDPEGFQARANALIDQVADVYAPPSMGIGDPEKYYWPKAMARFTKYGIDDETANGYIQRIGTKGAFHFAIAGLARLICQYPDAPQIVAKLDKLLEKNLSAGLTTSEGTENHITMERTSIYLIAQTALEKNPDDIRAQEVLAKSREWILTCSKRIFQYGIGEWNSSIYAVYSMDGWLNLFDFAKDEQVRACAKAVVDYYAAEIALHYAWGAPSGCELRGNDETDNNKTSTAYLGWLWFGTTDTPAVGFKPNEYIQSMHAATSSYRPSAEIIALAKKEQPQQSWYQNSKTSYLYEEPSYCKQDFYVSDNFTLGNLVSAYGGYTGASFAIIPWRLVVKDDDNRPIEIGGNGRYRDTWTGKSRAPFTQTVQYKNTLILLSKRPADFDAHYAEVTAIIEQWKKDWENDYFLRQYPKDNVVNMIDGSKCSAMSFLSFPNSLSTTSQGKTYIIDAKKVFVAVTCIHTPRKSSGASGRYTINDAGSGDELTGYAMEVIEKSVAPTSADVKLLLEKSSLEKTGDASVTYITTTGDKLDATFNGFGTCTEPLFDWGYGTTEKMVILAAPPLRQPDWGPGDGFGKIPTFVVNGKEVDYSSRRPVYDGPGLYLADGVMKVMTDNSHYVVDFTSDTPKWESYDPAGIETPMAEKSCISISAADGAVTVKSTDSEPHTLLVANILGHVVAETSFIGSTTLQSADWPRGCYIIKTGCTVKKVIL